MKYLALYTGLLFISAAQATPARANPTPLHISTQSRVTESGSVHVLLTLENKSSQTLHAIHPRMHFHHSMAMLTPIAKLDPGQSVTLKNSDHPQVRRVGRYPLVVMTQYKNAAHAKTTQSQIHTDSFYFREPVRSEVEGKIETLVEGVQYRLKIQLENRSPALKNVRLMLLLPPGLYAETFKGMLGFTLRGGESKSFEVPVQRTDASPRNSYPVHLMIEYAELLKHYSGEVRGQLRFAPTINAAFLGPHLVVLSLMTLALYFAYRKWGSGVGEPDRNLKS